MSAILFHVFAFLIQTVWNKRGAQFILFVTYWLGLVAVRKLTPTPATINNHSKKNKYERIEQDCIDRCAFVGAGVAGYRTEHQNAGKHS
jgi:hypothetical protein